MESVFSYNPRRWPTLPRGNPRVPSALGGLTTEFGMGSGVARLLESPGKDRIR